MPSSEQLRDLRRQAEFQRLNRNQWTQTHNRQSNKTSQKDIRQRRFRRRSAAFLREEVSKRTSHWE